MLETREEVLTKNEIHLELDDLRNDLRTLRRDISELAQTLMQAGKSEAAAAKKTVHDEMLHRIHQLRDAIDQIRQTGARTMTEARATVQNHPFLVITGALAAGYLLGATMRHRSKPCEPSPR